MKTLEIPAQELVTLQEMLSQVWACPCGLSMEVEPFIDGVRMAVSRMRFWAGLENESTHLN